MCVCVCVCVYQLLCSFMITIYYFSLKYDNIKYMHTKQTHTHTHIHTHTHTHLLIYIYIRGSLNKFPDFFRMGTFIDSTHMKLKSPLK